MTTRTRPIAGL